MQGGSSSRQLGHSCITRREWSELPGSPRRFSGYCIWDQTWISQPLSFLLRNMLRTEVAVSDWETLLHNLRFITVSFSLSCTWSEASSFIIISSVPNTEGMRLIQSRFRVRITSYFPEKYRVGNPGTALSSAVWWWMKDVPVQHLLVMQLLKAQHGGGGATGCVCCVGIVLSSC